MFALGFPLLLVPFAIYNIVAFLMPGVSWTGTLATVHMMSGADWAMSGGDVLIALCHPAAVRRDDESGPHRHRAASSITAWRCCCSLPCWPNSCWSSQAASATFFLLLVLSFFDVLGGFTLTLRSARPMVTVESSEALPEIAEPAPEIVEPAPKNSEHVPS